MDAAHLRWQQDFAAHLRDPTRHPPPAGVDSRGLATYRRLLLGNTRRVLESVFPRARRSVGRAAWNELVARFLVEADCASPYYRNVPGAFLDWLRPRQDVQPPWLIPQMDLAWTRFRLELAEDAAWPVLAPGHVSLNPVACLRCYDHAVHGPGSTPENRPVHLLLFRAADQHVRIVELPPASHGLLRALADGAELHTACRAVARDTGMDTDELMPLAHALLHDLARVGALRFDDAPKAA